MKKPSPFKITILAVIACLLWSTAFVGIKFGLPHTTPLFFAGIRFILAGLVIIPFCGTIRGYFSQIRSNLKHIIIVSFFQTFALYSLFYLGISMISGALTAIVIGSGPLFTAIIAHFMIKGDQMTRAKVGSILIGMVGIVGIASAKSPLVSEEEIEFIGILLLLLSNVASSFANVYVAKSKLPIHPLILNSAQIFIGGVCLTLLSLAVEGMPATEYPMSFYLSLTWLTFLSATAFSIWFYLLRLPDIKVSMLNVWKFLIPVFGALLSWMLLADESPEPIAISGMVLVSLSLIAYNLAARYHRPSNKRRAGGQP